MSKYCSTHDITVTSPRWHNAVEMGICRWWNSKQEFLSSKRKAAIEKQNYTLGQYKTPGSQSATQTERNRTIKRPVSPAEKQNYTLGQYKTPGSQSATQTERNRTIKRPVSPAEKQTQNSSRSFSGSGGSSSRPKYSSKYLSTLPWNVAKSTGTKDIKGTLQKALALYNHENNTTFKLDSKGNIRDANGHWMSKTQNAAYNQLIVDEYKNGYITDEQKYSNLLDKKLSTLGAGLTAAQKKEIKDLFLKNDKDMDASLRIKDQELNNDQWQAYSPGMRKDSGISIDEAILHQKQPKTVSSPKPKVETVKKETVSVQSPVAAGGVTPQPEVAPKDSGAVSKPKVVSDSSSKASAGGVVSDSAATTSVTNKPRVNDVLGAVSSKSNKSEFTYPWSAAKAAGAKSAEEIISTIDKSVKFMNGTQGTNYQYDKSKGLITTPEGKMVSQGVINKINNIIVEEYDNDYAVSAAPTAPTQKHQPIASTSLHSVDKKNDPVPLAARIGDQQNGLQDIGSASIAGGVSAADTGGVKLP